MGTRKKVIAVLAGVEILFALLMVLVPMFVFPVCESPMHCHYSFMAEIAMAAVVVAAAAGMLVSSGMEAVRLLSAVTMVAGLFVILFPSSLIGVCASPEMACHYGTLPTWNLLGGGLSLVSVVVFFVAKEESV